MTSSNPDGINQIKNLLAQIKEAEVMYISAGRYSLKTEAKDKKTSDNKAKEILENIEKQAKQSNIEFAIKEGKNNKQNT